MQDEPEHLSLMIQTMPNLTSLSPTWQERLVARDPQLRIHLLGIGGAGLSPIAQVLRELGVQVSGSDRRLNAHTQRLTEQGVRIFAGQQAANLTALPAAERPDVVLISSAVDAQNPERQAAEQLGIPVVKRSAFLPVLLTHRRLIAVAGTAGKSTTTAMIVKVLRDAGIEAGYIVGAEMPGLGNAAAGSAPYFVLEADEYDHMFLGLQPHVAVITNVEWDHPDCYPTPESFMAAFQAFVAQVPGNGLVTTCADDPGADQLYHERRQPGPTWITYGLEEFADLRAVQARTDAFGRQRAELAWWCAPKGVLQLQAPGLHNLRNALAALAVACWCDVPSASALASLEAFTGTGRRFELKGEINGVTVIDDYAHHPTKISATLAAARRRYPQRRLWAVLQPHTYSRTRHLLREFGQSLADADQVIVLDIYAARETDDGSIHARDIVAASVNPHTQHIAGLAESADYLAAAVQAGDVVVVMGAGDSYRVGELLLEKLRVRK